MKNSPQSDEKSEFSLSDFIDIIKKWKKEILIGALICASIFLFFAIIKPLKYESEGTFYEKPKNNSSSKNTALLLLGEEKENSAIVLLKSRKILESAIKRLDLQAEIEPYSILPGFIQTFFKRLNIARKNILVEAAYLTASPYPSILDLEPEIQARQVRYPGEIPLRLHIRFTSDTAFTVTSNSKGKLGEGQLGIPFETEEVTFTLFKNLPVSHHGKHFILTLKPARELGKKLAQTLKVNSDYKDKSFITLILQHPSRKGSSTLLNSIMESYREHLLNEHHTVVSSQVAYLKQRRGMMEEHLETLMHHRGEEISAHAGNLDLLVTTQQNLQKRLLAIDLEIKHIQRALSEDSYLQTHYSSDNDPPYIHQALAEIRQYKQQCDSLTCLLETTQNPEVSFEKRPEFQGINLETAHTLYINYSQELQAAEASALQNQFIIQKIQHPDFELSSLSTVLSDPLSAEIIKKAGSIAMTLKDQDNRTLRELERLNQDLTLQRSFLVLHLQQIIDLTKLRIDLLTDNVQSIQKTIYDLLQNKITIQKSYLLNYAKSRLNTLKHEQTLIQEQKFALQKEFDKLPEQWAREKLINLYLKTDGSLMEHIGGLIESKNIADHLEMSLSAPFDLAAPPLHPKSPALLLFFLLGGILGAFAVLCYALILETR